MPPEVADDELRPVTSLFADVVGSTSLGERLAPAEVKVLIGECVSRMCEAIEAFGGAVRSYMGDGVAGFFGIDRARQDDAERAVRAALEIRRAVSQYAAEVRHAWGITDFNVRIGINSGRVAVGLVGASDPQRVALGDAVNVAARLQSAARPGSIVVGAPLAMAVRARFVMRPVGRVNVRGRESNVEAYEIEAEERTPSANAPPRLIGRHSELDEAVVALRDLSSGRGQVLFVFGDSGVGKSRLLSEFRQCASPEICWLSGYCDAMDERLPHEPFLQMLRMWLGIESPYSEIAARLRFKARMQAVLGGRYAECAPHLARLLGVSLTTKLDRRLNGLPADALALGLQGAIRTWLGALAKEAPVVVAIDNFDAASRSTVELASALLSSLETAPIMLILTMNASVDSPARALYASAVSSFEPRVRTMVVPPLTVDESRELLSELAGGVELDGRLETLIVERAEGNPLYIEELFAALETRDGELSASEIPDALEGVLLARLDSLAPVARRAAQGAAVLGRVFLYELLVELFGSAEAEEAVIALLRADLIREHGRQPRAFAFRHGLIRDVALATLTESRATELHRRAADALEGWAGFDVERDGPALTMHILASGHMERAATHVERLATRLALACRWVDAAGLLERYLAGVGDRISRELARRLRLKLAEVLSVLGRCEDSLAVLDELGIVGEGFDEEVVLLKARCLIDAGFVDQADRYLAESQLHMSSNLASARFQLLKGEIALGRGDLANASRAVELLGDVNALPAALAFEGASLAAGVALFTGDINTAEMWSLQAQEAADREGEVRCQLAARRRLALICLEKGCLREAASITRQVMAQYAALGLLTGVLHCAVSLMHICLLQGELEEGVVIGEDALQRLSASTGQWEGLICANLAALKLEQGELAAAGRLARRVLEVEAQVPVWARSSARAVLSSIEADDGDRVSAESWLEEAAAIVEADGGLEDTAAVLTARVELAMRFGDIELAVSFAEEALNCLDAVGPLKALWVERACTYALCKRDPKRGILVLRRLATEANEMGVRLEQARALIALAELEPLERKEYFARAERMTRESGAMLVLRELEHVRARTSAPAPV